jgi:hypothetical protein
MTPLERSPHPASQHRVVLAGATSSPFVFTMKILAATTTSPSTSSRAVAVIGFLTILTAIAASWRVHGLQNSVPVKPSNKNGVYTGLTTGAGTRGVPRTALHETSNDKDTEIAQLEAQLRRLKEERMAEEASSSGGKSPVPSSLGLDSINDGPSAEEIPIAMFLSEGWKEKEATKGEPEGGGGVLTSVLGAVALAVFLAVFSQVPVGQEDLSKYSAIKAPSQQIDLGDLNRVRKGDL